MTYNFMTVLFIVATMNILGGESTSYELQIEPPNSNGSFCPGEIELTCIGRDAPVILNWFINRSSVAQYLFEQTDNFPTRIIDYPVNIIIISAIGSLTVDYVSKLSGNFSYLSGVSIECGRDSMLSNKIVVMGYVPLGVLNVIVNPKYDKKFELITISLMWQQHEFICPSLLNNFEIVVKNNAMKVVYIMNIQCDAKNTSRQCLLDIPIYEPVDEYYIVEITQVNIQQGNIRGPTYYSPRINGSVVSIIRPVIYLKASRCHQSITCVSNVHGYCEVFLTDSNFTAIEASSVSGFTNASLKFTVHLRNNSYYKATFTINSVSYELKGTIIFTPIADNNFKTNLYYIITKSIFLIILAIISFGHSFVKNFSKKWKDKGAEGLMHSYCTSYDKIFIIVETISFIISFTLWLVTSIVTGLSSDHCSESFLQETDVLLKVASVVTDINVLVVVGGIIILQNLNKAKINFKQPTFKNNTTKMKKNEAYEIHQKKEDLPIQTDSTNFKEPTIKSEMTKMKKNEAYEIHHNKKDTTVDQTDGTYDYMN